MVIIPIIIFLITTLLLVAILLIARHFLVHSGSVEIRVNGDRTITTQAGGSLLSTMAGAGVFLPSACGGKGSCGQCKVQITRGGGEMLPTEAVHFTRREAADHWRLACQAKVKEDMDIVVDRSTLSIREWDCTVISNRNVATFMKEFIVALPAGEHMDFEPGSYAQIKIPAFDIDYDRDIDRELIGSDYLAAWQSLGLFGLKCHNGSPTVRAYSMANYPAEGDRIMLTVRIATPPMRPRPEVGFQDLPPGIASTYIFSLHPGDHVVMSGPYGDFHPIYDSKKEMMWIGGGAGMAPLRAQIMHLTRTLDTRDRVMNYFYGARALNEVFYLDDFLRLEKDYPNFHFHLALDRPDPAADSAGVKYTPGFVHQVIFDTYLKDHDAPEDIEYYMCGPGPMSAAVNQMLDSLGVEPEAIHYDNFGA